MQFQTPVWFDQLESSNTTLLALVGKNKVESGHVIAAREQTGGRGRYGREWVSRPGRDLTFSFFLQTTVASRQVSSLTMAVAIGVSVALESYQIKTHTKWPNDLLIGRRKICGILAERTDGVGQQKQLVVGVGLNVKMNANEVQQIDRPATSMFLETGHEFEIHEVLERILTVLPDWIDRWEQDGFSGLRTEWNQRCETIGRWISVNDGVRSQSGTLFDFGECGELLLRDEIGQIHEVWAGDLEIDGL